MNASKIELPLVHLNGTGKQRLMDGYSNALDSVRDAITAFEAIEFNARDYYPMGPDSFKKAREEHSARLEALVSVRKDFETIVQHLSDL